MYLDRVKVRLAELNAISPEQLSPCTEGEIRALEEHLGLALPTAYREFLLWMGRGGGRLMRGSDCFYEALFHLREFAERLLAEDAFPEPLPVDAFVFHMHQGYQFSYLRVSEGDDPPIYYYLEDSGQTMFKNVLPRYSDFLMAAVNDLAPPRPMSG